jgi:hypothetical protein
MGSPQERNRVPLLPTGYAGRYTASRQRVATAFVSLLTICKSVGPRC